MTSKQAPSPATSPTGIPALLASNIRAARLAADLTQARFAAAIGISESQTVSNWERALQKPSDENLTAICSVTGHDLAWFYTEHPTAQAA